MLGPNGVFVQHLTSVISLRVPLRTNVFNYIQIKSYWSYCSLAMQHFFKRNYSFFNFWSTFHWIHNTNEYKRIYCPNICHAFNVIKLSRRFVLYFGYFQEIPSSPPPLFLSLIYFMRKWFYNGKHLRYKTMHEF